jgi:hypothetical protein
LTAVSSRVSLFSIAPLLYKTMLLLLISEFASPIKLTASSSPDNIVEPTAAYGLILAK